MSTNKLFSTLALLCLSTFCFFLYPNNEINAQATCSNSLGTGTSSSATRGPFQRSDDGSNAVFSRANLVYTQAEVTTTLGISSGATITQIRWDLGSTNIITASGDAVLKIYMKNSAVTGVTDEPWANIITGQTLVGTYTFNTTNNFPGAEGFMDFPLATNFVYTGASIEIAVEWDCSGLTPADAGQPNLLFSGNGSLNWHWSSTVHESSVYRTGSSSFPSDLTGRSRKTERVNTQFCTLPSCENPTTSDPLGTGTSSSATRGPFQRSDDGSNAVFSRANLVYTQAEVATTLGISAGHTISQINWDLGSTNIITASGDAVLKIYMKNSAVTGVTDEPWANIITGQTLVGTYTFNTTNNFPGAEGFMAFPLATNFVYTGASIEVAVEWDCSGLTPADAGQPNLLFSGNGSLNWHWSATTHESSVYRTGSSSFPSDLTGRSRKTERVNTQFVSSCPSTSCDAPSNLSAVNVMTTTADLSWSAASGASGYNWKVVTAGAGATGLAIAMGTVTGTTVSATGLTTCTSYDLHVQTDCGSGQSDFSAAYNFMTGGTTSASLGTSTSSSATRGPFQRSDDGSNAVFSRANLVYTQAEVATTLGISTGSTISQINWDLGSTNIITASGDAVLKIYMKNSAVTGVTDEPWANIITGQTLVGTYTFNTTNNFPGAEGFMAFPLATNFVYTGASIEVAVEWDCSGLTPADAGQPNLLFSGNGSLNWHWSATTHESSVYRTGSSSFPSDLTGRDRKTERVNTQFIHSACEPPICNGTGLVANASLNTYDLITSVLAPGDSNFGPSEVPDCGHAAFGDHITQVNDATLGKDVFAFHVHVNEDNDRCINFDRQRNEIKTYSPSPDNLKGVLGETVQYKWKFKLPAGFQSSAKFTHIHQLKSVGASDNEDSMPQITFTTRKGINGNPDQLELRYAENFSQITWAQTDLTPFKGAWVEAIETVTYGDWGEGKYSVDIKKVSDGSTLLTYTNNATRMWKTDADFIRPKWGIYRSLDDKIDLRDETVCFADFCIEETATATSCAAVTTYLNAKDITASTAELSWGGVPGAVNYNWKVVLAGAGATGAAVAEGTSPKTSTVVSSLDPTTSYDFHVEADCGSSTTTGFSAAHNFMTTVMTDEVCANQIGTEIGSSSSRGPIHQGGATSSTTRYSRYFQIFTQAELAAIDLAANNEITELRWFITTTDVIDELGDAPFKIYIKNSTATVAAENNWAALTSGATLALDTKLNATNNFPGEAGWMPFTLDAPFVYTGGALEIAVEWNWASVAFTNGGTVKWQYSNFANDVMVRALGTTEHSNNLTKSSTSKQRANIQICYTPGVPPSCPAPANLNATNITINSADLSWDAVGSASSYNWKVVGLGAGANATAIASGSTAGLTASATNLSCFIAYDLHVQADCGGGDLSTFSKAHTFVTLSGVTPTTTTIGTGTNSSSSRGPIQQGGEDSETRYSRFNQVFTETELLAAGLTENSSIAEIQWYLNSTEKIAGSGDAPMKVYIKNSAAMEATAIPWSTAIAGSALVVDRVFNTTKNFPGVTGWMPFTFNTPFVYTGGGLEIAVEWDFGSISIPAFTGSDASNPNGKSIKWRYSSYADSMVVRLLGTGSHGTSNLSFAKDNQPKDRADIQFVTVLESSCPTCAITNLTVSACPNGTTGETEVITIQDANNPSCAASIEVPVCSDGAGRNITFTSTGGGAASTTFNLLVDGALKAVGGIPIASGRSGTGGNFAFYNIITPATGAAGGVTPTGTPEISIADPCNCDNPNNLRNNLGQVTHFHDILTVSTGAAGQTIVLAAGSNAFLDASLTQVADNVVLGTTNASGILETEFFHADKVSGTITILNQTTGISESFSIQACVYGECTPIPTMSEWGLFIFGLLIMNLSVFFVQRRELI